MVYFADWGSEFDAPMDVVWQYVMSPEDHGPSHKGRRNIERKPLSENSVLMSWEQESEGKWIKMTNKMTFHPPVGFFIEPQEGPMAGSKFLTFYVPSGNKTQVVVVGEFTSKNVPAAEMEKVARGNLESVYNEDVAGLKAFTSKKKS
jgi:hypothetical protein